MTLTTAAALALDGESIAVVDLAKVIFSKHCLEDVSTLTSLLGTAGLIGLGVAEDRGGSGGRLSLSALVAEQAGVHLAPPALLHRELAVALLAASGAQVEQVRAVASGAASALVAFDGSPDGRVPFAEDADLVLLSTADGLVRGVRSDAADDDRWKSANWHECRVSRSTESRRTNSADSLTATPHCGWSLCDRPPPPTMRAPIALPECPMADAGAVRTIGTDRAVLHGDALPHGWPAVGGATVSSGKGQTARCLGPAGIESPSIVADDATLTDPPRSHTTQRNRRASKHCVPVRSYRFSARPTTVVTRSPGTAQARSAQSCAGNSLSRPGVRASDSHVGISAFEWWVA